MSENESLVSDKPSGLPWINYTIGSVDIQPTYTGWRDWYAVRCKILGLVEASKMMCDGCRSGRVLKENGKHQSYDPRAARILLPDSILDECRSTEILERVAFYVGETKRINEQYRQEYPDTLDAILASKD